MFDEYSVPGQRGGESRGENHVDAAAAPKKLLIIFETEEIRARAERLEDYDAQGSFIYNSEGN